MITEIDVDVPVRTAYNQWTQFEDFPLFMDHISKVEQLDDLHVRFTASIVGVSREWVAEITEQSPDQRVAWKSVDGTTTAGVVTFHPLDDEHTRVVLQLDMDPSGLLEHIADKGGFVDDRARKDLKDFKEFIEQRGRETGSFRESIDRDPHHSFNKLTEPYQDMSKAELFALVRERNLDDRPDMTKDDYIEALALDDKASQVAT